MSQDPMRRPGEPARLEETPASVYRIEIRIPSDERLARVVTTMVDGEKTDDEHYNWHIAKSQSPDRANVVRLVIVGRYETVRKRLIELFTKTALDLDDNDAYTRDHAYTAANAIMATAVWEYFT